MNEVELQGNIITKWEGRSVSVVRLFIEANSSTKDNPRVNFPTVIFNYADRHLLDGFNKGDFVHIKGHLKVRTMRDRETGKIYYQQYVRGYDVIPVRSEMSEKFDTDLGGRYEYINEVLTEGVIMNITTRSGMISMLVRPTDEKFNLSLVSYAPNKDLFMRRFTVGSTVCVKSELQTSKKDYEGEGMKFFEDTVVVYIDKKKIRRTTPVMDDPTGDM